MRSAQRRSLVFVTLVLVLANAGTAMAQQNKVLTLEDYARWRRVASTSISPDGGWMTYAYRPNEGDDTLYVEELDGEATHVVPHGANPSFSGDSRWVALMVSPPGESGAGARGGGGPGQSREPATRKVQIIELSTGEEFIHENATGFQFSEDARFLAVKKRKMDEDAEHDGTDLILRGLQSGTIQNLGNVREYAFNETGALLAYTIDAEGGTGNGLYLMDLDRSILRTLDGSDQDYEQMVWNEEGTAIAVLRGREEEGKVQKGNTLMAFTGLGGRRQGSVTYDPGADAAFPEGMVISEFTALRWSEDSSMLFLGVKEQREEPPEREGPGADVDVWHWMDEEVQSVQMRRASRNRRATYASVLHLEPTRFLKLADEDMLTVSVTDDGRWGVGRIDTPYRGRITWGGGMADYYRVDTSTGERSLIVEGLGRAMGTSPDGKWYVYLKDETVWAHELESGRTTNLSEIAGVDFVNRQDDHPYELPAHGIAGWSKDGKTVLLNQQFDIWSVPLAGGQAVNVTGGVGEQEQIRFRYVRLDPEEETIDTSESLLLSAYGEWTKKSGYYSVRVGRDPRPLIFEDQSIGSLRKAQEADRIILTMQTFVDFPDYYVTDTSFRSPRRVTDANPQQAEYAWGRRVLVDYTDSRGNRLQATLTLPAGYQEGRKYPMLVYFYELMSGRHHQYSMPTYDDRPHMSTYASDGYLVLMPDVVYTIGRPGSSALDDLTASVQKVIELGYADPERIGLQGHSWGGYQSSFVVTQTDMFAAVVTGAPPTNLISFYNTLYKSSGTVQQGITEVGQVRMGATPFEDFELFLSQSPIHHTGQITTPFLILHGTEDGSVDWMQGLEYYNMARRQGKEVIFLSYPGEGHHLSRQENQKDFQIRMKQFFDHYLKGAPAPKWMTEGVPHLEKEYALPSDGIPPN
jgi:dipeptidyl aminopeptidase/acylaminoacyl peptidase